jgi:hypothetical protein
VIIQCNKNVDIEFSAQDASLGQSSSGTFIIKIGKIFTHL